MQQFNPLMQVVQMAKSGNNPQQIIMNMIQQKIGNTPIGKNLLELAKNNDGAGIELVARNMCAQRGLDFDKEFAEFKKQMGL